MDSDTVDTCEVKIAIIVEEIETHKVVRCNT